MYICKYFFVSLVELNTNLIQLISFENILRVTYGYIYIYLYTCNAHSLY